MSHKPDPFSVPTVTHEDNNPDNNDMTDAPPPLRLPNQQLVSDWTDLLPPSEHVVFLKSIDWGKTYLGPMQSWSLALRQSVYSILAEVHPANLYWGSHLVSIYNEPFAHMMGGVHPFLMGHTFTEALPEVTDHLIPLFQAAFNTGITQTMDYLPLSLYRGGKLTETVWTGTLIPIRDPETQAFVGLYNRAFEVTDQVIAERRTQMIQRIAEQSAALDTDAVYHHIIQCLETASLDITMAVLYIADKDTVPGKTALEPKGAIGVPEHHILREPVQDLIYGNGVAALCRKSRSRGGAPYVAEPCPLFDGVEWRGDHGPSSEIVVLTLIGGLSLIGYLIIGFNPRLQAKDNNNMQFLNNLSRTVSTSIFSALTVERSIANQQLISQHLAAADKKVQHMVQHMSQGMVAYLSDGSLIWANKAYFKILGLTESAGQRDYATFETIYPEDLIKSEDMWRRLMGGTDQVSEELRLKRLYTPPTGDPEPATVLFHAFAYFEDGGVSSIMASISDISAYKWAVAWQIRQAEDARNAKRRQELFMDIVSHEIRNPLSAIIHCADEMILSATQAAGSDASQHDGTQVLDEIAATAQVVLNCANHQLHILNSLLLLGPIDSALVTFIPSATKPRALCEKIVTLFGPECRNGGIEVKVIEYPTLKELDAETVNVDVSRITQILINLFANAVKFVHGETDRRIELAYGATMKDPRNAHGFSKDTVWPAKGEYCQDVSELPEFGEGQQVYLTFSIADSGVGISSSQLHRMFAKFKQVHGKTHAQYSGSGLGLYISKQLIERQGGEIGVSSKPGVGTLVGFYIHVRKTIANSDMPIADAFSTTISQRPRIFRQSSASRGPLGSKGALAAGSSADEESMSRGPRILLVEDNLVNQKLLQKQLSKQHFSVTVANHGVEALDHLKETTDWKGNESGQTPFHTILMDIEMPVMNGLDCMREIRRLEREGILHGAANIITITANAREEQQLAAKDAGADMIITKPFKTGALVQAINNFGAEAEAEAPVEG